MGKRITNITIDNFKGYYSKKEINLPNGENLLIYGENGSGKSSLFTALKDFFSSGIKKNLSFQRNFHRMTEIGEVSLSFSDFSGDGRLIKDTESTIKYSSDEASSTTYGVQFVKDTAQTLGFLDYKEILKLYNLPQDTPNLFDFIVLGLLGNQSITGYTRNIQSTFQKIVDDTITNAHTRRSTGHKSGLYDLKKFDTDIRNYLGNVFKEVNQLLNKYFPHFSLTVNYQLEPMKFNYGIKHRKSDWSIAKHLILVIENYGRTVSRYGSSLNEARLSAISICLYLASLKQIAAARENKTLFLDDIFIGLDSGNRMPIVKILQQEFLDYQVFIATYDRGWYNLLNHTLCSSSKQQWKSIELYESSMPIGEAQIFNPILVESESDIELAKRYIFSLHNPDYPAAANYLRKSFEKLLSDGLPDFFYRNENLDFVEQHRLTKRLDLAISYVSSLSSSLPSMDALCTELINVKKYLHCLLHPLSHSVPDLPIYKQEIISVYNSYYSISQQLEHIKLKEKCICVLEANFPLRFFIKKKDGSCLYYYFKPIQNFFVYFGDTTILSDMKCHIDKMYMQHPDGNKDNEYHPEKNDHRFTYNSIQAMIDGCRSFLPTVDYGKDAIIKSDSDFVIEILNTDNTWRLFLDYIKGKLNN